MPKKGIDLGMVDAGPPVLDAAASWPSDAVPKIWPFERVARTRSTRRMGCTQEAVNFMIQDVKKRQVVAFPFFW